MGDGCGFRAKGGLKLQYHSDPSRSAVLSQCDIN